MVVSLHFLELKSLGSPYKFLCEYHLVDANVKAQFDVVLFLGYCISECVCRLHVVCLGMYVGVVLYFFYFGVQFFGPLHKLPLEVKIAKVNAGKQTIQLPLRKTVGYHSY